VRPKEGRLEVRAAMPSATTIVGLLTVIIAICFTIPQWMRLRRTGSTAGLSLASLLNSGISLTAWTLYGLARGDVWVTTSSLAGVPVLVLTIWLAVRLGAERNGLVLPIVWGGLLTLTAFADHLTGSHALDVILGCSILWFAAPAAVTAWRSADVSGLTYGTWLLLGAEGLLFGVYGALAHVSADLVYATACVTGAGAMIARLALGSREPCEGECAPLRACMCPA
jgi:uncharacterized protein with PQ loop repeat